MKKTCTTILVATALTLSAHSMGGETYYGGGLTALDVTENDLKITVTTLHGLVGTRFNENIAAEIRLGTTIADDTVNGIDVEVESFYGAYLKGGAQISETIYPYIIAGYTRGKLKGSYNGYSASESESDAAFGVGVDLSLFSTAKLNLEYISYLDKGGSEFSGFSLGFSKAF